MDEPTNNKHSNWNTAYGGVILFLIIQIVLFYLFTKHFS